MSAFRRAAASVLLVSVACIVSTAPAEAGKASTSKAKSGSKASQRATASKVSAQRAAPAARQELIADASPTTGNILTFSARFSANFQTASTGDPVSGLRITYLTAQGVGGGQPLCIAVTDQEGDAKCTASFTGNIFQPVSGFLSGYDAIFKGNALYAAVTAHSTATPGP
jgi:hypothetical protein